MSRNTLTAALVAVGLALMAGPGWARVGVEIWTDRGQDAVYKPGDLMQVKVRPSADAYLLVYEIDTDGYVRVLYPYRGQSGFVEGRRTLRVPDEDSNVELVVERNTGEAYLVALASEEPFDDMPWYLRPYDARSEGVDYEGVPDQDEQGVTSEGRIVGDPFVAMERIRRRVLRSPEDPGSFGTSYTSYYVHERVRYPRYLCYDCHRPNRWAWWDGFDPYYSTCSVVDFRINWGWSWGPGYWFGNTPYWCYVMRSDCPPRWRHGWNDPWYSSWDGYPRWTTIWGGPLVRYKSPPPPGYVPPSKYDDPNRWRGGARPLPPGFLAGDPDRGRYRPAVPIGRNREARDPDGSTPGVGRTARPGADRMPGREVRPGGEDSRQGDPVMRPRRDARPQPSGPARGDDGARAPRQERRESPAPAAQPHEEKHSQPAPAPAPASPPREERTERSSPPPPPPPAPAPRQDGGGSREKRGGR
jgi:hypothetical protein